VDYVDSDTARDTLQRRCQLNVIDMGTAWKADVIIRRRMRSILVSIAQRPG
jgi:hypothetical protein